MTREEAIETIRRCCPKVGDSQCYFESALRELIPELRESEDERIRQWLIDYYSRMKWHFDSSPNTKWLYEDEMPCKDIIAWLEKQKENPKTKDSIPSNCASNAKCEDRDSKYGVFPEDVIVVARACEKLEAHGYPELAHALKNVNLYTKPVDYDHEMWKNCEANFEGGKKEVIDHPEKYGLQKEQRPVQTEEEREYIKTLKGLISDFIRDSGGGITDVEYYQNIFNWLDGRHVEQKPADYNEYKMLIDGAREGGRIEGRKEVIDHPEEYGLTKQKPAMSREKVLHQLFQNGSITLSDYLYLTGKQKPAEWSKNDTVFLEEIIDFFENKTVKLQHDLDMYAHWLKSLSERFNLQPKQEWSEEDEKMLNRIIETLSLPPIYDTKACAKMVSWLKSLRPSWKPSEEQMDALRVTLEYMPDTFKPRCTLMTLQNDLEKLT